MRSPLWSLGLTHRSMPTIVLCFPDFLHPIPTSRDYIKFIHEPVLNHPRFELHVHNNSVAIHEFPGYGGFG